MTFREAHSYHFDGDSWQVVNHFMSSRQRDSAGFEHREIEYRTMSDDTYLLRLYPSDSPVPDIFKVIHIVMLMPSKDGQQIMGVSGGVSQITVRQDRPGACDSILTIEGDPARWGTTDAQKILYSVGPEAITWIWYNVLIRGWSATQPPDP